MRRIIFAGAMLCLFINVSTAQTVIQVTADQVYAETLVIDEDTILEGIGNPTLTFLGDPKISVKSCNFLIKNVQLQEKRNFVELDGDNGLAEWYNIGMIGFMTNIPEFDEPNYIDGTPRN